MNTAIKTTALGEIVDLVMGQAPPSKETNFERRGTPFVKVGEFGELRPVIREWTTKPLRMAQRTDVLLCVVGATCGKINLGEECAIGRSVAAIRPNPAKLDQLYLYYFMMTLVERLRSGSVGAAQTVISKEMVQELQIPVPPLPEQQRIVALLDEAFAGLATAKANAERNLRNARALFESHLTVALSSDGKKWPSRQLDSLLIKNRKISYGIVKPGIHDPNGVRIIKSQQVRDSAMDLTEDFRITKELDEEYARTRLQGGEVLLNLVGASIGRSAIAPSELKGANVSRAIAVIPVHHEFTRWVQYNLRCSVGQTMIQAKTGGAAQPVLNLSEVKSMGIPFPPLNTQQAIVESLESLREETHRLALLYEQKLAALVALKKSLLHQAFSGEL